MSYKFYSKEEVRDKYIAKGSFYSVEQGYYKGYRNDLHILDRNLVESGLNLTYSKPDILFIMMNPGGSEPINKQINSLTKDNLVKWLLKDNLVDAIPDETQDQIMRIMWNTGAQHSRIINISDIREGSSKKFYPLIKGIEDIHSIFSNERTNELDNVFGNFDSDTFIFKAWGVNENLSFRSLVGQCLKKLSKEANVIGLEKNNDEFLCYHPYSPNPKVLELWFNNAMELIYKEIPEEWFSMLKRKYDKLPSKASNT
ncbi:hypothetical protein [Clostridium sartagoforme]|nr:hypothetical protein [Clostridium sartagoforme]